MTFNWQRWLKVLALACAIVAGLLLSLEFGQIARGNAPWARAWANWQQAVWQSQFVVYAIMGMISALIADRILK